MGMVFLAGVNLWQFGTLSNGAVNLVTEHEQTLEELRELVESFAVNTALTNVRADSTYGDTTGTFTATLREATGTMKPVVGAVISFTLNGQAACGVSGTPACPATNAQGVASFTGAVPAGINAGTYRNAVGASFAGANFNVASRGSGPLVVARRILWVKASDRTVGLKQPNPPTTPPAGCVAQQTATSACWVELARGSSFVNGDDWADLGLTTLRFQYARNPPSTNATEYVGKTYRITAFGETFLMLTLLCLLALVAAWQLRAPKPE